MLPRLSENDIRDCGLANAEFFAEANLRFSGGIAGSYLYDLGLGKACASAILTASWIAATFIVHVGSVVLLRSKKQMSWVYARRIVATMQDAKSLIEKQPDWIYVEHPTCAMGEFGTSPVDSSEDAVAAGVSVGFPFPAFIRTANINLFPESFRGRLALSHSASLQALVRDRAEVHASRGPVHFSTVAA